MIDEHNPFSKSYRMAAERFKNGAEPSVKLKLIGRRLRDARLYNIPTCGEVAALIVGMIYLHIITYLTFMFIIVVTDNSIKIGGDEFDLDPRDIVLEERDGNLKRINELHPSYLPMQYPLLFPYGEDGFHTEIKHTDKSVGVRNNVTIKQFLSYRIFDRKDEAPTLLMSRKLFQQFCVDGYMMMETQRLGWFIRNQPLLRTSNYKAIDDAIRSGVVEADDDAGNVGKRLVLPSSFVGGPRYMVQNYQDTMAICKYVKYPELFITFTCNPKWPEITRFVESRGLRPEDRPDKLCRVFKMKLDELIKDLKTKNIFGKCIAGNFLKLFMSILHFFSNLFSIVEMLIMIFMFCSGIYY